MEVGVFLLRDLGAPISRILVVFLSGGKGLRLSSYRFLSFLPIDLKVLLLFKDLAVQNL